MASFAVIRHTETGGLGVVPAAALDMHRANGWIRVSDFRTEPGDIHLEDFADVYDDLDAEPAPKAQTKTWAKADKESSE